LSWLQSACMVVAVCWGHGGRAYAVEMDRMYVTDYDVRVLAVAALAHTVTPQHRGLLGALSSRNVRARSTSLGCLLVSATRKRHGGGGAVCVCAPVVCAATLDVLAAVPIPMKPTLS
jgi:hypothetical protein